MFILFMWNGDNKLLIKYSKRDDINESRFEKFN